ncbi:hypothetical protein EYC84_008316 [Monilinia fructicola]|uniref:Uncharacterized protein n=1 Tax=Monilinia fructicola TaxID=38448 RepID=A0A5M9JLD7_MONFR|nr:hypothetical protein EYC84_008316 [Monilinia fructicola]
MHDPSKILESNFVTGEVFPEFWPNASFQTSERGILNTSSQQKRKACPDTIILFFCYYSTADGYPSHLLYIFNQRRSSFIFSTSFIFTLNLLSIHHRTRYFLDLLDEHSPSFRPENKFRQFYIHPLHKQVHRLTNTKSLAPTTPFLPNKQH